MGAGGVLLEQVQQSYHAAEEMRNEALGWHQNREGCRRVTASSDANKGKDKTIKKEKNF